MKAKKRGKIRVTNWELQALSTITEFWPSISLPLKLFFTFHQIHFVFSFVSFCFFTFHQTPFACIFFVASCELSTSFVWVSEVLS